MLEIKLYTYIELDLIMEFDFDFYEVQKLFFFN